MVNVTIPAHDLFGIHHPETVLPIRPIREAGGGRTGSLSSSLTYSDICNKIGFAPNVDDDYSKVKYSWGFAVGGKKFGIWDYKGARWSTDGDAGILKCIFGDNYTPAGR